MYDTQNFDNHITFIKLFDFVDIVHKVKFDYSKTCLQIIMLEIYRKCKKYFLCRTLIIYTKIKQTHTA